jgi:hypothetical protein
LRRAANRIGRSNYGNAGTVAALSTLCMLEFRAEPSAVAALPSD